MHRFAFLTVFSLLLAVPAASAELSGNAQANGKPVQNAVIWLDAPGAAPFVQEGPVVVDQRNLSFSPHVLAVRVGTLVEFPNSDHVFHNVFSFKDGKKFDLGMYPAGAKTKPVDASCSTPLPRFVDRAGKKRQ